MLKNITLLSFFFCEPKYSVSSSCNEPRIIVKGEIVKTHFCGEILALGILEFLPGLGLAIFFSLNFARVSG